MVDMNCMSRESLRDPVRYIGGTAHVPSHCLMLIQSPRGLLSLNYLNKCRGYFLKKLWCCIGGDVKHKILDLITELVR